MWWKKGSSKNWPKNPLRIDSSFLFAVLFRFCDSIWKMDFKVLFVSFYFSLLASSFDIIWKMLDQKKILIFCIYLCFVVPQMNWWLSDYDTNHLHEILWWLFAVYKNPFCFFIWFLHFSLLFFTHIFHSIWKKFEWLCFTFIYL